MVGSLRFAQEDENLVAGDSNARGDQFLLLNPLNNQAPSAASDSYQVLEDEALSIHGSDAMSILSNDNDADGDPVYIAEADQLNALAGLKGLLSVQANGGLLYTPFTNNSGTGSVDYTVTDGLETDTATVQIEVIPVNDQPVVMVTEATINTSPASGLVTINNWASFNPGALDEFGQTPLYLVTNVSDPTQFTTAPQITQTGDLIFETTASATQSVTFDVFVQDDGGTDNGGIYTSTVLSVALVLDNDLIFSDGFE